jgi:hypothetical protein
VAHKQKSGDAAAGAPRSPRRRRWRRGLLYAAIALVVLVVVGRIVLDPIAAHYTRRTLATLPDYRGTFEHVHVTLLPPSFQISRVKIIEHPGGVWKEPLFYAERVETKIFWRQLLHGAFVGRVRIESPKIVIARQHEKKTKKELPGLGERLNGLSPILIDRMEIRDGELLWAERPDKSSPQIWLHGLEVAVENIATRPALAEGRATTATVAAKLQRTGELSAFVSADPFAKSLTFAGRAAVRHLALRDLYAFTAEKSDIQAKAGTLDLFAEFEARDGKLTGGVKPVLENVELGPSDKDFVSRLKAWLADKAIEIASDRVPGREAVATVIPIRGTVKDPQVQLVPAILGVIRNAFVVGLASGFAYVPPPEAEKKKGVFGQMKDALTKKPGPAPAQPEKAAGRKAPPRRSP